MTKSKIQNILEKYLEDKPYLYYDQGMYPKWITKDEIIALIIGDILNNEYNEEEIKNIIYCYHDNKKNNN